VDASPSENPAQTAKPRKDSAVARRIAQQIDRNIDGHAPSGDAFVVSVYGEWGIGKTYCLDAVKEIVAERLETALQALRKGDTPARLTIPVKFDPWQYEHEEHLVVPLLKTIEYEIRNVLTEVKKAEELGASARVSRLGQAVAAALEMGGSVAGLLGRAATTVGQVAAALACSVKFKVAPLKELGIEAELDLSKGFDYLNKLNDRDAAAAAEAAGKDATAEQNPAITRLATIARNRESLYFDTKSALTALTDDQTTETKLRLVILIDDLDRCLPEKAVQMLESVKLFVNVPGFSFVLAVDDEVVERGIAHRYRDYLKETADGRSSAQPISGAEYLEKIIHLPVHLPRWTMDEARKHLTGAYPDLFGAPARAPDSATSENAPPPGGGSQPEMRRQDTEGQAILDLLLFAIPLVPRKLIRLAEGIAFQAAHITSLGEADKLSLPHLARLVAIQQLYPALYRFVRGHDARYWRLFEVSLDEFDQPQYGGNSLGAIKSRLEKAKSGNNPADAAPVGQATAPTTSTVFNSREQYELLNFIEQACNQRGAPNPLRLFRGESGEELAWGIAPSEVASGLTYEEFHRLYIHNLKLDRAPPPPQHAAVDSNLQPANIPDPAKFIAMLMDPDRVGRTSFLQSSGAVGRRLPDTVFNNLVTRIQNPAHAALVQDLDWLADIASITSPAQLVTLYNEGQVLEKILAGPQAGHAT
jgi:hypothetical protein